MSDEITPLSSDTSSPSISQKDEKRETNSPSGSSDEEEHFNNDAVLQQIIKSLAASSLEDEDSTDSEVVKQLAGELTLEGVAKAIREGKLKKILVMSGAGISVASGIPDFRSPGTGLYDNLQEYNLPEPEAVFDISFFKQNPEPFTRLARALFPGNYPPTKAHYFIRLLDEKGLLVRNFTQNIDTLEREAGLNGDKIVEAHGSFASCKCIDCLKSSSISEYKEQIFDEKIPKCECGGLIKPNIVFFGENLPDRFWDCRKTDFKECDLLIVMGTSLQVNPFAGLIHDVLPNCVRLLLNREEVGKKRGGSLMSFLLGLGGDKGFLFDEPNNTRDVKWLGDIEDAIDEFVKLLGWETEFEELYKERDTYLQSK